MAKKKNKPTVPNFIPGVGNLTTGRYDFQAHVDGTSFNHTAKGIGLSPLITIQSIQYNNVQDAIAALALIVSPNPTPTPAATTTSLGTIQLSGDIGGVGVGSATNIKVTGLQGRPVSILSPTSGQVLTWSGTAWTPTPPVIVGLAGGDLSGTYQAPGPTVIALRGNPVAVTAPATGQFLGWNGSTWTPTIITLIGDVTGTNAATVVTKLQGTQISPTAPTITGQTLTWNGSLWAPTVSAANLARGWVTNNTPISPSDSLAHIVLSTIVTPGVTGKFRLILDGYVDNATHGTEATSLYLSFGHGTSAPYGTVDYLAASIAYLNYGAGIGSITTVAASVDLDKLSPPVTFPIGTPVQFNIIMSVTAVSGIQFDAGTLHFTVQEVF